ncbi:unnamed protein product [Lactuca virosa]|uniref:Uncharacterized protein n=1 Tax=Lactuca virosa TaxID=75947 RepID=A0AAU9MDF1_9ASTR|nr:unnamed protein product [Lactuca virosa]
MPEVIKKKVVIGNRELTGLTDVQAMILAEVRDATVIPNLIKLCREEGFANVKIRYVGRLWVWVMFESVKSCKSFPDNVGIQNVFAPNLSQLDEESFIQDDDQMHGLSCDESGENLEDNSVYDDYDPEGGYDGYQEGLVEEVPVEAEASVGPDDNHGGVDNQQSDFWDKFKAIDSNGDGLETNQNFCNDQGSDLSKPPSFGGEIRDLGIFEWG